MIKGLIAILEAYWIESSGSDISYFFFLNANISYTIQYSTVQGGGWQPQHPKAQPRAPRGRPEYQPPTPGDEELPSLQFTGDDQRLSLQICGDDLRLDKARLLARVKQLLLNPKFIRLLVGFAESQQQQPQRGVYKG